jgi:hypothetical protein
MKPYDKAMRERLPPEYDARYKYTDIDKADALARIARGESRRQIERDTGISRRTLSFWENPEAAKQSRLRYKESGQAHKSYLKVKGEKWARIMRGVRRKHIEVYGKKYGVKTRTTRPEMSNDPSIQSV